MMRRQITLLMAVLFAVAALAATQIQDLTTKRAEEVTFSAKVAEALAAPVGGVATLTLDADYTADAAISVPAGTQLAIDGAGHTLTLGAETNFIIQDGITLKNLKIDATALTKPLIAMGDTTGTGKHNKVLLKDVEGYSNINQNAWILEKPVTVENCMVKELATPVLDANKYSWALNELNIRKSIIQMNNDANSFINMDGAGCAIVKVMNITENTIYNLKDNASKFFIKGSNASNTQPKKIYGTTAAGTYVWTISNNTMVKTFSKKDFANSTPSINTVTMAVKGNVFLDVYRLQKLFGNCVKDYEKNIIWANEITLDGTDKSTYCTEADPGFKAPTTALDLTAENGGLDLKPGLSTMAAKLLSGDPRWLVPGEGSVLIKAKDGSDLTALLEEAAGDKIPNVVVIKLDKNATVTVSKPIVFANSLYIDVPESDILSPASATIDASGLEGPMITTPAETPAEWVVGNVSISDVKVKGLKKALFASAAQNYLYETFAIMSCVVEQAGDATTFDFTKGSTAVNFTVTNSTIYAPTATTQSLYSSQGGQKTTEAGEDLVQTFTIKNSTLYNLAPGKNFFTHRQNSQKWLTYDVQNNIFVNCGKSGQTIKGLNGGGSSANPTWIVENNIFNFNGEDTSAAEETGDADEPVKDSAAGVMAFNSVETPDFGGVFTLAEGAAKPSAIGDVYHWTVTYSETATGIEAVKTAEETSLENAVIYNLNGQRIDKAQAKSGVFIVNGRKVVMK